MVLSAASGHNTAQGKAQNTKHHYWIIKEPRWNKQEGLEVWFLKKGLIKWRLNGVLSSSEGKLPGLGHKVVGN